MLEGYLIESCQVITYSYNEYGDYVQSDAVTESCRFRYIDTIRRNNNQELNDSDALIHLSKDTSAVKGSIIKYDGVYYQIERMWKAKKLGSSTVEFVKADLKVTDINIS